MNSKAEFFRLAGSTVYVKYYLYHHVYFVGDTIK